MSDSDSDAVLSDPRELLFKSEPRVFQTLTKGDVGLRWLSGNSLDELDRLRSSGIPDADFLIRALHAHLAAATLSYEEFSGWPAADIEALARDWSSWHAGLDSRLPEGDTAGAFAEAFDKYSAVSAEQHERLLAPVRAYQELQERALGDFASLGAPGGLLNNQIRRAADSGLMPGSPLERALGLAHFATEFDPPELAQMALQTRSMVDLARTTIDWEAIERRLKALAPYAETLGRRGWTFPIQWGGTRFVDVVQRVPEGELDDGWVGYYTRDNGQAFEDLAAYLAGEKVLDLWRPLLEGALYAYRRGHHEAAVTSLLAVFSGLLALGTHGLAHRCSERRAALAYRSTERLSTRLLCRASLYGFVDEVFRDLPFSEPATRLNRHHIMHGRGMPPSPRADALRLFQAIETLTMVARAY